MQLYEGLRLDVPEGHTLDSDTALEMLLLRQDITLIYRLGYISMTFLSFAKN